MEFAYHSNPIFRWCIQDLNSIGRQNWWIWATSSVSPSAQTNSTVMIAPQAIGATQLRARWFFHLCQPTSTFVTSYILVPLLPVSAPFPQDQLSCCVVSGEMRCLIPSTIWISQRHYLDSYFLHVPSVHQGLWGHCLWCPSSYPRHFREHQQTSSCCRNRIHFSHFSYQTSSRSRFLF